MYNDFQASLFLFVLFFLFLYEMKDGSGDKITKKKTNQF